MAKTTKIKVDAQEAKQRLTKIIGKLKKAYPEAKVSLDFSTPLELLVATILSAQCTDARVNAVTARLFKKYRTASNWADVDQEKLEEDVHSCGFYRNKAKSIKKTCRIIADEFDGTVPDTMEGLLKLAGVGRKTANVILGNAFGGQGIVCDTHVIRLSRRLGLSENSDPVKLEYDLMEIVPKRKWGGWTMFSHLIVYHGRGCCIRLESRIATTAWLPNIVRRIIMSTFGRNCYPDGEMSRYRYVPGPGDMSVRKNNRR
ncbi:MAG: endonuclease III [Anaerohalosphaera sp.]|nr:endonuclease III [Anaerohalosphaera sp.]